MIVYFTGTGNSRYCAQFLAQQLQEECRDVSSFLRNGVAGEWTSERPWVFVAPTYCWPASTETRARLLMAIRLPSVRSLSLP